jgi:hypothetical protein
MKIYVDGELPKNCDDCELGYFYDCQYCSLRPDLAREDIWVEKEKHCPLLSIKSLKQQVREEAVEQVNDYIKKHSHTIPVISQNRRVVYNIGLTRFLNQVKGEKDE